MTSTVLFETIKSVSIARMHHGGFLITWTGDLGDANDYDCYFKEFHNYGYGLTPELMVNTNVLYDQDAVYAAVLTDGNVIFVWKSTGPDGNTQGLLGKIFDSDWFEIKQEFLVRSYSLSE